MKSLVSDEKDNVTILTCNIEVGNVALSAMNGLIKKRRVRNNRLFILHPLNDAYFEFTRSRVVPY